MHLKSSLRWVAVGLAALASVIAVAAALGQWHAYSLDEQGKALVDERQYLPAVRILLRAVAEAPSDARAHYYLGLAYAGAGLCRAAWIHLEEAARLAPASQGLRRDFGPACRAPIIRPDGADPSDIAVPRGRQGGTLQ